MDWPELFAALRQPVEALFDASERIFWPFLLASFGLTWLILGPRAGTRALRSGLLSPAFWLSRSTRTDVGMIFVRALISIAVRIPWLAATAAVALWIGLGLHSWLGPAPELQWPGWLIGGVYTLVLFVVWDASRFLLHVALHRLPWLWPFHAVHHSADVLTPLTLYRVHPVESVLYDLRGVVSTAIVTGPFLYLFHGTATELQLLGINGLGFVLNAAGGNLRHSHVWLRFGPVERWLLSPAQHQMHHGRARALQHSNYGTWLAVWDRWLGTWKPAPARPTGPVGLDAPERRSGSVLSLLVAPFVEVGRIVARQRPAWAWPTALVLYGLGPRTTARASPPEAEAPTEDSADFELDVEEEAPEERPEPSKPAPPRREVEPSEEVEHDYDWALDKVSIVGSPDAATRAVGSAHRVGEEELERKESDDIHRVLRTVPGVYVREEDGFGLRPNIGLRGASSDRSAKVTLMEDGVLLAPAPYAAPAAYYFPMTTRMVGVEVFKGPASIRYGPNTIGGAINLQTRPIPRSMRGYADLGVGMRGYGKLHGWWGTSLDHFGVLLEGARVQSNGFKELDGGGDTGFGKNELMVKTRFNVDPNRRVYHQFDIKGGVSTEESNETYLGLTDEDFAQTPYRRYAASRLDHMSWWRTQAQATWFIARGSVFDLQVQGYRHDFHRVWRKFNRFRDAEAVDVLRSPDVGQPAVYYAVLSGQEDSLLPEQTLMIGTNDRRYASDGLSAVAHWRPTRGPVRQDIEIGARIHHDEIRRVHTEDGFLMTSGMLVPEGTDTESTARSRGTALAGAFHVVDELRISRFTLTPGARVEVIGTWFDDALADTRASDANAVFIPGLGAHVLATPWLGVLAGVHSGFSPVAPGQLDEVRPERSVNYEAGARVDHPTRRTQTRVEAIGFLNDYTNLTSECTFSAGCDDTMINRQFNAGEVLVWGVEATAAERLGLNRGLWLEGRASYTYTGSRFGTDFMSDSPQLGDVRVGDELPYVPEHLGSATLGFGGRIWGLDATGVYVGDMRDIPGRGEIPEEERIARHFVIDLGGRISPTEHLTVYTGVQNLLDTPYIVSRRPFGARPGQPFQFMIGLKYEFY